MRRGVLQRILSRLLGFTAVILLVPLAMALFDLESTWYAWASAVVLAVISAYVMARLPRPPEEEGGLRRREGLLAVVLGWLVLVSFTALGYHQTFYFGSFAHAFFESMSGYTTTGATVIADIEGLPRSVLLMRSFSHWVGGMGIIVLSVAILPELSVGGMQLVGAESSGIDSEKLAPRIASTARRLWGLYLGLTLVQTMLLMFAGMGAFDAVNHAMATIATGGFSTKNASVAGFASVWIDLIIIVFMFVSGMNFIVLFRAFALRKLEPILLSREVHLYALITVVCTLLVTLDTWVEGHYDGPLDALRYSTFQVVSILTTTGFGTADFDLWSPFSKLLLVACMLVGACAGSTAGGFKVVRLYVVMKHARMQLRRLLRPRRVETILLNDRPLPREATEEVLGFLWLYVACLFAGSLLLTALGMDLVSGTTAAVSALNSVGPGLGTVGPVRNFGHVPALGLYGASFGMLLGRLEIFTVLVLFTPRFWRQR